MTNNTSINVIFTGALCNRIVAKRCGCHSTTELEIGSQMKQLLQLTTPG